MFEMCVIKLKLYVYKMCGVKTFTVDRIITSDVTARSAVFARTRQNLIEQRYVKEVDCM